MKWLEVANSCYSSYKQNDLGWVFHGLVRSLKPSICVEIGVLEGYSAIFTGAALRDNGMSRGMLYGYDLWEKYPYRHVKRQETSDRIREAGLEGYVKLGTLEAKQVIDAFDYDIHGAIDFLHIDINNDGDTFEWAMQSFTPLLSLNGVMVLEGGSWERDKIDWMVKYNKPRIRSVLEDKELMSDWEWYVHEPFPSLTVMRLKR